MDFFIKNIESGLMPIANATGKTQSNTPPSGTTPPTEYVPPKTPGGGNTQHTPINIPTSGGFNQPTQGTGGTGSTEPTGNTIPITEPNREEDALVDDTFYGGGYGGGGGGGGGMPPEEMPLGEAPKTILGLKPKLFYGLAAATLIGTYLLIKYRKKAKNGKSSSK